MEGFKNVLHSNRKTMTAEQSIDAIRNYALYLYLSRTQDAKLRSRSLRHAKASWVLAFALSAFPVCYLAQVKIAIFNKF